MLRAIDRVAEQLNNTRAVCRKYYVHPAVFDTYLAGTMLESPPEWNEAGRQGRAQREVRTQPEEAAVVRLLRHLSAT